MVPTQVQIDLDQAAIREYIQKRIDQELDDQLFLIDLNELSRRTTFSKRFLEEHVLRDVRVKRLERRKGAHSKRVWYYKEVMEAVQEIIEEW